MANKRFRLINSVPVLELKPYLEHHRLTTYMTDDWISHVSSRLPETDRIIQSTSLRASMFKTNYFGVLRDTGFGYNTEKYKRDWNIWCTQHSIYGLSPTSFSRDYFHKTIIGNRPINEVLMECWVGRRYRESVNYDDLESLMINLNSDPNDNTHHETSIRIMLQRIYVNSTFKSISTTAVALGVRKDLALMWIIQHCLNKDMADAEETKLILDVIQHNRGRELLDWLGDKSFGFMSSVLGYINPTCILHSTMVVKEKFFLRYWQHLTDDVIFDQKSYFEACVHQLTLFMKDQHTYKVLPVLY